MNLRPLYSLLLILCFSGLGSSVAIPQINNKEDSLRRELLMKQDNQEKVYILNLLTEDLLTKKPDVAETFALKSLSLSQSIDDKQGQLDALINLSEIYQIQTRLKEAIEKGLLAKELAQTLGEEKKYARSLLTIANSFRQLGEFTKSSDFCFEALDIFESLDDQEGICAAINGIGIIYYQQDQYDKALEYFVASLEIAEEQNYLKGIARGLNNTSNIYSQDDKTKAKSIAFLKQAIEINKQLEQNLWLGINYSNLGGYYLDLNQMDSSFFYINASISIYKELEHIRYLSSSYEQLSRYYLDTGNDSLYLYYADKSMEMAKANQLKNIQLSVAASLESYYYKHTNYQKAYEYKHLQYVMKDSLEVENSLNRLSQLEILYDLEKVAQERKIKSQREDFLTILIILCLFGGLIVVAMFLFHYRSKVRYSQLKQQKLQDELSYKNKEMTANVMSLMKKNEMLSEITQRLIQIENNAVKTETKEAIRKVGAEIENSTNEKIWEEFEMRFKQVHSEFYENLIHKFPELSPNEQRLCAFLRLNLSTKEISNITGQSSRAIEMARFRLRKKLGISSQDINLIGFISKI